jgi:phosphatidylethanolamine-binding protein (PEBP) family uncharacterized protein
MASRRDADGLLAKLARRAGAGALAPALAASAALAVSGCGGADGSAAQATSTAASTSTSTRQAEAARPSSSAAGGHKQGKAGGKPGGQAANEAPAARQGAKLPQPQGEREPGITPAQRKKATTASIALSSPGFAPGATLPAANTCTGKDTSPALRWSGVPDGTAELVLLVLNVEPVQGHLFFDWAVGGLDPSLEGIEAGKLPQGAVLGRNGDGKSAYSICPPKGGSENYVFMLYAIPTALEPKPGFSPIALREAILAQAGNVGLLGASYAR